MRPPPQPTPLKYKACFVIVGRQRSTNFAKCMPPRPRLRECNETRRLDAVKLIDFMHSPDDYDLHSIQSRRLLQTSVSECVQ